MALSPQSRVLGQLPSGESVEAWMLTGSGGLQLEVITYGGIVTRLLAPDREGRFADIVLGFRELESYLAGHPYFGAIIGRVAGRIAGARFTLDEKTYELAPNQAPNHLHGGVEGFDKKIWTATPMDVPYGGSSLRLSYRSRDGEEGYPGTVDVTVTYTITGDNCLAIHTEAVTDRPTPFNITHHSYFNLCGEGSGSIADHELQIHADQYVPVDEHLTLLGRYRSVSGQANDFRESRRLGAAIPNLFLNHGDLYLLRKSGSGRFSAELAPAACLVEAHSGRALNVSTTETHLQLYTAAALDGTLTGKSGVRYGRHAGICLECHGYPDGANAPLFSDNILRPERPQRHTTMYAFSTVPASASFSGHITQSGRARSSSVCCVEVNSEAEPVTNLAGLRPGDGR
jgi:aldose 1-epimerase